MSNDDLDLLRQYARRGSQVAFATLVNRHLNLVYSVALRVVRSPSLAEEVAQSVFTDLARSADKMKPDTILTAWLYRVIHRTAVDVVRRESRRQNREQKAVEMAEVNSASSEWTQIEPLLEEVMEALEETDRAVILLRHFENKSLREVGSTLGISDDAAQKRVSRAVDHLRECLAKRGVAVGAGGLVVAVSAGAVQAAPAGLAALISMAALTAASVGSATTTATIIKAITVTTTQKILIGALGASLAVAVGTAVHEIHHASQVEDQLAAVQTQREPLAQQVEQLRQERDSARMQLEKLQRENAEIPHLRAEVARLQSSQSGSAQAKQAAPNNNDPFMQSILALASRALELYEHLEQMPDKRIPELKLMREEDWLTAAKLAKFDTDEDVRRSLSKLRELAKRRLPISEALRRFIIAYDGQLPTDISQLKPYLHAALGDPPFDDATIDAILARYTLLRMGNKSDLPPDKITWIIAEKAAVDKDYDTRAKYGYQKIGFGEGWPFVFMETGIGHTAVDPDDQNY